LQLLEQEWYLVLLEERKHLVHINEVGEVDHVDQCYVLIRRQGFSVSWQKAAKEFEAVTSQSAFLVATKMLLKCHFDDVKPCLELKAMF
jgi:hypothetical protein